MSSIALYGLIMFYGLTHEELKGKRPLAKFLSIKLIVMFTFYQSFIVSAHSLVTVFFSDHCYYHSHPVLSIEGKGYSQYALEFFEYIYLLNLF